MIIIGGNEYRLEPDEINIIKELYKNITLDYTESPSLLDRLKDKGITRIVPLTSSKYELTTLGHMLAVRV